MFSRVVSQKTNNMNYKLDYQFKQAVNCTLDEGKSYVAAVEKCIPVTWKFLLHASSLHLKMEIISTPTI